jgi:GAF domain-containing protein
MTATLEDEVADLQRTNAELQRRLDEALAERDEALEQQTATAEVLKVINSSPGDLAPVFETMLDKAFSLCGATYGSLQVYDGERFRAVAVRGLPEAFGDLLRKGFLPDPKHPQSGILRGERFVQIPDMAVVPGSEAAVKLGGMRTALSVPLRKDGALLGQIVAARPEVRPFSDKEIALLENFAAQAVIAMENARLLTETREALDHQTATNEVLQTINSSPGDLGPVFDAMLEKAIRLCRGDRGVLWTIDGDRGHLAAARGLSAEFIALLRQRGDSGTNPALQQIIGGERLIEFRDTAESEFYRSGDPLAKAAVEAGVRSLIWVALVREGVAIGVFAIGRSEVGAFSGKQIALLQNFAAQAVIAMENARLITETREALEQQTATAEVLQVINSSPGDLSPVFEAILEKAHSLCGAAHGSLMTFDGEFFRAGATHGLPDSMAEFLRGGFPIYPGSPQDRLVRGERFVHIPDRAAHIAESPPALAAVEAGVRTVLAVPLRKDGALLGYIAAARLEVSPFSDKQIALLENFAAQAVIAMENARLLTETREALERQTATAEVLQVINSSPGELAPVFNTILERATRLCEAPFGVLRTWDGERFHLIAAQGDPKFTEWAWNHGPWTPAGDSSPAGRIVRGEEVVRFTDAPGDEAVSISPAFSAMVEASGMRSGVTVALRKDYTLRGTVTVFRREVRPFTDKQIALLQNFAAQAVIAMENARLLGELRQRTDEIAGWNRELEERVAEQVEELGRVGRLKRFLAPQLAELIVSQGDEKILESHRRDIVVVFCDVRGYTAFTETAEPEEVLDFLREYHGALGPLVSQYEGTLDQFSGDGIMVFFNDPVPIPDPAECAVRMAVAMREAAGSLTAVWRERGRDLGFGAGIAQGYATLGQIGFSERSGYTAIGTVCNVAARLCAEAKDGQILLSQRVNVALKECVATEQVGALALKGLTQPVVAYNVPLVGGQAALRVLEGGAPNA